MGAEGIPDNVNTAILSAIIKQDNYLKRTVIGWVLLSTLLSAITILGIYLALSAAARGATYLAKIKNFSLVQAHGTIMGGIGISLGIFLLLNRFIVWPQEGKLDEIAKLRATYKILKDKTAMDDQTFLATVQSNPQKLSDLVSLVTTYETLQAAEGTNAFIKALGTYPLKRLKQLEENGMITLSAELKTQFTHLLKQRKKLLAPIMQTNSKIFELIIMQSYYKSHYGNSSQYEVREAKIEILIKTAKVAEKALDQFYLDNVECFAQIKANLKMPNCTQTTQSNDTSLLYSPLN